MSDVVESHPTPLGRAVKLGSAKLCSLEAEPGSVGRPRGLEKHGSAMVCVSRMQVQARVFKLCSKNHNLKKNKLFNVSFNVRACFSEEVWHCPASTAARGAFFNRILLAARSVHNLATYFIK